MERYMQAHIVIAHDKFDDTDWALFTGPHSHHNASIVAEDWAERWTHVSIRAVESACGAWIDGEPAVLTEWAER